MLDNKKAQGKDENTLGSLKECKCIALMNFTRIEWLQIFLSQGKVFPFKSTLLAMSTLYKTSKFFFFLEYLDTLFLILF